MTAPAGAIVSLYVDLVELVAPGDVIATQTGRRYEVLGVRVQLRGRRRGRQHLSCSVLAADDDRGDRKLHTIRWYARKRGKK